MKNLLSFLFVLSFCRLIAQPTYNSSNYASVGDTIFLTRAQTSFQDFESTGSGFSWNFGSLTGASQTQLVFRAPTQTGYSALVWPFIFNSNNTNLSSTNSEAVQLSGAGLTFSNLNDYFKKSSTDLRQVASAYRINTNNLSLAIRNQFSSPDVIYRFPVGFGNEDSSFASFVTVIPATYYQSKTLKRKNVVDGWGQVTTPFGSFPNALRLVSTVEETDSFAFLGVGIPKVVRNYRELKWLDPDQKYPVLIVTQTRAGSQWVTSNVEYLDSKQFFQPLALFSFTPVQPIQEQPVNFQNLSTNATSYQWDFGDPGSGSSNFSAEQNPEHIFLNPGTYSVQLISSNDLFSDTVVLPVKVFSDTVPSAGFTYQQSASNCLEFQFTNTSVGAQSYVWNFGDTLSPVNSSILENPSKRFSGLGTYWVQLIASNGSLKDTILMSVTVSGNRLPGIEITASPNPVEPGQPIQFNSMVSNGGNNPVFQWQSDGQNTGENTPTFEVLNPVQGQKVRCILTSSDVCANPTQITSNEITIQISEMDTILAPPVISPSTGTYSGPQMVTLSTSSAGASIYYTTSGNIPVVGTSFTKLYTGSFQVLESTTVRAMTVKTGLPASSVTVSYLTITNPGICAAPVISPASGNYEGSVTVVMSTATLEGEIWYTTNGNNPRFDVPNSFTKRYLAPFTLYGNTPVKAITIKSGLVNSPIVSANYTITQPSIVATPTFSPLPGNFGSSQNITLSTSTPEAQIYYTTNGNVPRLDVPNSFTKLYTGPLVLNQNATIRALAVRTGWQESGVAVGIYTFSGARGAVAELEPSESGKKISVFPNPSASGIFYVVVPEPEEETLEYSVLGMNGKEIQKGILPLGQSISLDLSRFPQGLYLMNIRFKNRVEIIRLGKQ